ncbi:MAG: UvrB/UvrC motif-containing protein [Planctomycetota bacterium]
MICESCKKSVATVHLTEIINKTKKEIHLCETCAQQKGMALKTSFSISELLGALDPAQKSGGLQDIVCSECGASFSQFRRTGRLGCARDYELFKMELLPLFEKIHGATQHRGKTPKRVTQAMAKRKELDDLEKSLQAAIENEEYEKAAQFRDRIHALEKQQHGSSEQVS